MALSSEEFNNVLANLRSQRADLSSTEGLSAYGRSVGLSSDVNRITNPAPRLSFLQRLGSGLGAFNPGNAIATGMENGLGAGLLQYPRDILTGVGSAITGTNYQPERKMFADVVDKLGIKNGIAKFGIGLVGDILLDPTTYFGGEIVRGLGIGAKTASEVGLGALEKVAPETAAGLSKAGEGISDALGSLFNPRYKTTEGMYENLLDFLGKKNETKLGLIKSNLQRLGTGTLDNSQMDELVARLIAGKRAEFTARAAGETIEKAGEIGTKTALEGTSKPVADIIAQQSVRSQKIVKGVVEDPYQIYFPFLKQDKVIKFINETKGLSLGSQGYLKQFKNLLTDGELEKDVVKAFTTRENQVIQDKLTSSFLHFNVANFGKPLEAFQNADQALQVGYRVIREKGLFGKEIGYLTKWDYAALQDLVNPKYLAVDAIAKATGFDAVTSLFKRSVTGLFAPFHVRNYVSGMIQNYETLGIDALNPAMIANGQKLAFRMAKGESDFGKNIIQLAGKNFDMGEAMTKFAKRFGGGSRYTADINQLSVFDQLPAEASNILSKSSLRSTLGFQKGNMLPLLGQEGIPFKTAQVVGQFIETQQKAVAYLTAIGKGKNIEEALNLAEKAGFDYRVLTQFESKIMRRIIPFYSFTKKNIELQLRTLGTNPERINQLFATMGNVGYAFGGQKISSQERQSLPDYIKESFGIKLADTPEGLKQYISSFGTPVEAFADLFGKNKILKFISMTNPIIKAPIEIGIGKDSFREKDLKDVYDAREYKDAPKIIQDILDITLVTKPIYQKNAFGKYEKTTNTYTQYVADPVKLLIARSLFSSRGFTYFDQAFGGDIKGFAKAVKLTTGLKPQVVNLELQQGLQDKEKKRALEDLLAKKANVKQFSRTYIPKK